MAIKLSGTLAISEVSVEMLRVATYSTNLNETPVRTMAGVPTGLISLAHLYGKSFFQGLWAGNSIAVTSGTYYYGIEVSGGSWRWYHQGNVGAWITTNVPAATFTGSSFYYVNGWPHGFETYSSSVRMVGNWYGAISYGAWLTFTTGVGWSGGSSAYTTFLYNGGLETSSGLIRSNIGAFQVPVPGPWTSLT